MLLIILFVCFFNNKMAKGSLLHWGPLIALSIIATLFIGSIYSSLVWWPPVNDVSGIVNICLLVVFLLCILFNFIKAAWVGPGHVPLQWKPVRLYNCHLIVDQDSGQVRGTQK